MKFWEMRYGDEPADSRLFILRFMSRIHIVILSALLCAAAVCACHLFIRLSSEKMYMTESDLYLEYIPAADSNELIYFNKYTWEQMSHDSAVIDEIIAADPSLDPETVKTSFLATLNSDVKVLTLQVKNPDPDMAVRIMNAAIPGISAFAESLPEIVSVRVIGAGTDAAPIPPDIRLLRSIVLGALIGILFSVLIVSYSIISDDRIYLPETIEKRYLIPAAGTLSYANIGEVLPDLAGDDGFILASALPASKIKAVADELKKKGAKPEDRFLILEDTEKEGLPEEIKKADKPIVYVFSSDKSTRSDERALSLLSRYDKEPMCAVLTDSHDTLVRNYYLGKHSRFAKMASGR